MASLIKRLSMRQPETSQQPAAMESTSSPPLVSTPALVIPKTAATTETTGVKQYYVSTQYDEEDDSAPSSPVIYYHDEGDVVFQIHGQYLDPHTMQFLKQTQWHTIAASHGSVNVLDSTTVLVTGYYRPGEQWTSSDVCKSVAGVDREEGESYMFTINSTANRRTFTVDDPRVFEEVLASDGVEELRMVETPNKTHMEFFSYPRDHIIRLSSPITTAARGRLANLTNDRLVGLCQRFSDMLCQHLV